MKLDKVSYGKFKMIYKMSKMVHFLEKHAVLDAEEAGDINLADSYRSLQKDLEKYIEKLQKTVCVVSQ